MLNVNVQISCFHLFIKNFLYFVDDPCIILLPNLLPIIIFVVVFMGDENASPPFKKREVKRGNFNLFNINPNLVTHHQKGLLNIKTITLTKSFFYVPGQNGSLTKLTSCRPAANSDRADLNICKLYH